MMSMRIGTTPPTMAATGKGLLVTGLLGATNKSKENSNFTFTVTTYGGHRPYILTIQ